MRFEDFELPPRGASNREFASRNDALCEELDYTERFFTRAFQTSVHNIGEAATVDILRNLVESNNG